MNHNFPDNPESNAWNSGGRPGTFVSIDESDDADCRDCQDVPREGTTDKEHIVALNCRLNKGYSGWRIGAVEMRVSALRSLNGHYNATSYTCLLVLVHAGPVALL